MLSEDDILEYIARIKEGLFYMFDIMQIYESRPLAFQKCLELKNEERLCLNHPLS